MEGLTSAQREFYTWVMSIDESTLNDYEKKLLNILCDNYASWCDLGTAAGRRAKKIAELIEINLDTASCSMPKVEIEQEHSSDNITFINELIVGPFRGFKHSEKIVFDKKYTFMYGPNGSGKSSFCEALEFALVGEIEEAEAKRIPVATYTNNEHTEKSSPPALKVKTESTGPTSLKQPNPKYRFSFIEKNRIDAFARLSAASARNQTNRISSLFGLDHFGELVDGFTAELDERYLTLSNAKQIAHQISSGAYIENLETLTSISSDISKKHEEIGKFILDSSIENATDLKSLTEILTGESGTEGLIGSLIQLRGKAIPDNSDLTPISELPPLILIAASINEKLKIDIESLEKNASALDFQQLYDAIISLEERSDINTEICPACTTPLKHTTRDPFKTAKVEKELMQELVELQSNIDSQAKSLIQAFSTINETITKINLLNLNHEGLSQPIQPIESITYEGVRTIENWRIAAIESLYSIPTEQDKFSQLIANINENNETLGKARKAQGELEQRLSELQTLKKTCEKLHNELITLQTTKNNLDTDILSFQEKNEETLKEIEKEKKLVTKNQAYKSAYTSLTSRLRMYRETLPTKLAEGLATKAIEFYNIINSHDPSFETITDLYLPKVSGEKIIVKFKNDQKKYDALQILSEGHIKGLGLSLLLSKITHDKLNFIIYDDIVNAIDDDHRDGIAELMIRHDDIKDKQQIITCHGELFIIKLLNKLGASDASKLVRQYNFTPADAIEERGVRLSIGNPTHYLTRANEHYKANNLKETLTNCRRAIEGITENIWKDCARTLRTEVTVKIRRPGDKPDLPSTIDGLIKIISAGVFINGPELVVNLQCIKDRFINFLINKGTHHDDDVPEFERADAIALINHLTLTEEKYLLFSAESRNREKALK
ncbi:AAA family ATPase [Pseudomonas umsongensis]